MDKINLQHITWQRLLAELKLRPHCCLLIEFSDGLPMAISTVMKEDKMKLA